MRLFFQKLFLTNFLFVFFLLFSFLPGEIALGASSPASIEYEKARVSYHSLIQSKKRMQKRDQWMSVIQKFNSVYRGYSSSGEAYKAVFTIGDLYEQLYAISRWDKDLDKALENYKKTINEFKPGRLTDDALYRQGEIYFNRGKYTAALGSFQTISKILPHGDVAAKAKVRIADIRPLAHAPSTKITAPVKIIKIATGLKENLNAVADKNIILEKIDYKVGADSVRVVTYTSSPVSFSQGRLSKPERVYINFNKTRLDNSVTRNIKIGSRFLKGLRLSQFDEKNSRLVFDLNNVNNLKIGIGQEDSKLLIELSDKNPKIKKVVPKPLASETRKTFGTTKKAIVKTAKKVKDSRAIRKPDVKKSKKRINKKAPLIVVDAGHGGRDLGAKGNRGLLEKDVNLAIALRLKGILKSSYKYQVILTRKDDTFIPLSGRGKIANDNNADVFVSVHANAAPRRSAQGIETYYLGTGHSTQAKETAIRENGGLVKSVKDDQTQEILASMISTTKINKSSRLASSIQNQLYQSMRKKYPGIRNLGVKEGPFFVLHDTSMASVLVEVGFLTNRKEESYLKKSSYLDKLASSIAKGIAKFIHEYDPMI